MTRLAALRGAISARLTAFGIFLCLFPLVAILFTCLVLIAGFEFGRRINSSASPTPDDWLAIPSTPKPIV